MVSACVYNTTDLYCLFSLQANEVLLVGHKLTAVEAYDRGLVTRVFPAQEFQDRVKEIISRVAGLPPMVDRFVWTVANHQSSHNFLLIQQLIHSLGLCFSLSSSLH